MAMPDGRSSHQETDAEGADRQRRQDQLLPGGACGRTLGNTRRVRAKTMIRICISQPERWHGDGQATDPCRGQRVDGATLMRGGKHAHGDADQRDQNEAGGEQHRGWQPAQNERQRGTWNGTIRRGRDGRLLEEQDVLDATGWSNCRRGDVSMSSARASGAPERQGRLRGR